MRGYESGALAVDGVGGGGYVGEADYVWGHVFLDPFCAVLLWISVAVMGHDIGILTRYVVLLLCSLL